MSYCCLAALLDSYPTEGHLADESAVKAIALFDHEEVGSASAQGMRLLSHLHSQRYDLPLSRNMQSLELYAFGRRLFSALYEECTQRVARFCCVGPVHCVPTLHLYQIC